MVCYVLFFRLSYASPLLFFSSFATSPSRRFFRLSVQPIKNARLHSLLKISRRSSSHEMKFVGSSSSVSGESERRNSSGYFGHEQMHAGRRTVRFKLNWSMFSLVLDLTCVSRRFDLNLRVKRNSTRTPIVFPFGKNHFWL